MLLYESENETYLHGKHMSLKRHVPIVQPGRSSRKLDKNPVRDDSNNLFDPSERERSKRKKKINKYLRHCCMRKVRHN